MTTGVRSWLRRILTLEVMLFFGVWLVLGAVINGKALDDYGQTVTEAIVDKHQFGVEKNTAWPIVGDLFGYEGHSYSNKNPGQMIVSSIVYAQLRVFGISYANDLHFAGGLVVFFSTSLFTAFAAVLLYRLARDLSGRRSTIWPVAAALAWALCTTQTVFAVVAWHDPLAAPMFVIAVYCLYKIRDPLLSQATAKSLSIVAGFLLGFSVTTSPSFLWVVVVFGIYFLTLRRWDLLMPFVVAGIIGVAPMPIYNAILFGNPLTFPAVAGFVGSQPHPDVYFFLSWDNFVGKIESYYTLITWYCPILFVAFAGLFLLPSKARREQVFIVAAILVHCFYMFNIETLGVCGYGPRYLTHAMPFCCLGIAGFSILPTRPLRLLVGAFVFWIALFSFGVSIVGAIGSALYCGYSTNGYPGYLNKLLTAPLPQFPLFSMLLPFIILWCVWAIYSQVSSRSAASSDGSASWSAV